MTQAGPTGRPGALLVGYPGALGLALVLASCGFGLAGPLNSLAALDRHLKACLNEVALPADSAGSEVTVLFSLRRDGSLLGRPRITYSRLTGDAAAQRAFLSAALSALDRCLPLDLDAGLGSAIAGRPLRVFIVTPGRQALSDRGSLAPADGSRALAFRGLAAR